MGKQKSLLAWFFWLACLVTFSFTAHASASLKFSDEEQAWLEAHPKIHIGIMNAWPPMDYVDNKGQAQGIGVEFVRALNARLGGRLKITPGPWKQTYEAVKARRLDALMDITPRPDREAWFHFTEPYVIVPHVIFARTDAAYIEQLSDLRGRTVGVERGFFIVKVLRDHYPDIEVREYDSTSDALDALSRGETHAYIGNRAVAMYIIESELIANVQPHGKITETSSTNAIGVRKDWPMLRGILQKALDDISTNERRAILRSWLVIPKTAYGLLLSDREQRWLESKDEIRVAAMDNWPPFNFIGSDGRPSGIGSDLIEAINLRLDGKLKIVSGPWKQIYDRVKTGELDAIMDITPKPAREEFFNFTTPYLDIPHVIIAHKAAAFIPDEDYLSGKTLALEKGFGNVRYFRERYPEVSIREYRDTSHALGAVSRGEADAYAGNRSVALYVIEKEVIANLKVHGRLNKSGSILAIGTRKDWPMLGDILQKVLDDISPAEKRGIVIQWVMPETEMPAASVITLTDEEKSWLASKPVIRTGADISWAPVEYLDDEGNLQGISSDYLKQLETMLGVRFEVAKDLSWQETVAAFERGELDMLTSLQRTAQRENYADFTEVYNRFPIAIFTGPKIPYVSDMEDMKGLKVGVVEGYATHEILAREHPDLELVPVARVVDALKKVSSGEIDAFVGSLLVTGYYIGQLGYTNIKVAGETGYAYQQSMAVRKDWPMLVTILNKALAAIPAAERVKINKRWISVRYEHGFDYDLLWKLMAVTIVVFLIFIYWNRHLASINQELRLARNQEQAARREAQQARIAIEEANKKLMELDQLKSMFIASMSHELRTPLNSIIGFSGALLQGLSGDINAEQRDDLQRVYRAGNHLLDLISDVIDISKIEAGRIEVFLQAVALKDIVDDAVQTIQPLADNKQLELSVEADSWPELVTDRKRLFQCLLNYLSNAVKFTEQGQIVVRVSEQGEWLDLSVTDSGIGIAEQDIPKLFEAFERLESHLRLKAGGTGLGLYLTKKIVVELFHGETYVESKLDVGTTFGLRIPRVIEEPDGGSL